MSSRPVSHEPGWFQRWSVPMAVTGFAIGVAGFVWAIYSHYTGGQKRELSYCVLRDPVKVLDQQNNGQSLYLVDLDRPPVVRDVYLVEMVIWNSGSLPLLPADVIEPIILRFPGEVNVLSATVAKADFRKISGWKLRKLPHASVSPAINVSAPIPRVAVEWANLDPGFAARIQILCTSRERPVAVAEGFVSGAGPIKQVFPRDESSRWDSAWAIVGALGLFWSWRDFFRTPKDKRGCAGVFFMFLFLAFTAFGAWLIISFPSVPLQ